jgi:pimeloyl-ACP methyl ester carboxylesterase
MPYPAHFLRILLLVLAAIPIGARTDLIPTPELELFNPAITLRISFPLFSDGSSQSALKPGDQFSVYIESDSPFIRSAVADLHELGLPSEIPLQKSEGRFISLPLTLPADIQDGAVSLTAYATDLVHSNISAQEVVTIDSLAPTGEVEASFSTPSAHTDTWEAYVHGSYSGTGTEGIVTSLFINGFTEDGTLIGSTTIDTDVLSTVISPFSTSLHIPPPHASWKSLSLGMTLLDEAGNITTISSRPFPRIDLTPVRINHAIGGSVVTAPNFLNGAIPSGIGIPHSLINTLPEGEYFAVVFFSNVHGCPSGNYALNSFLPNSSWGYDIRGPHGAFSKAFSSSGGGCMQEFYINPRRGEDWMWGAISHTGTSSAIADVHGTPAFAICTTYAACDAITVSEHGTSTPTTTPSHKLSNVLFLPGIKGSKLYIEGVLCAITTLFCDIQLWPPITDTTTSNLYLDERGTSIERVYTKEQDIVSNAYGHSFYDAFAARMNAIATSIPGWEWRAVAYDWRLRLSDLVTNGSAHRGRIYYEDASPYILENLQTLASTSATRKVTIVAHSNGGLVAKALVHELGEAYASTLIDSIILVGVPQSGAPRAITALLFGNAESLPGIGVFPELLLSAAHARTFGLNAPMTYHLLPSKAYTASVQDPLHPLVSIGGGILLGPAQNIFGSAITTAQALHRYLGGEDGRTQANEDDLRSPAVANSTLLSYADQQHNALDAWTPTNISVYQIAGWGLDTISGVEIYEQAIQTWRGVTSRVQYRPKFIEDGDGTVPIPSALLMSESEWTHRYWVNLLTLSESSSFNHGTLFEIPDVTNLIASILEGTPHLSKHIHMTQPQTEYPSKKLLFVLHDPANLRVQNQDGEYVSISSSGEVHRSILSAQADVLGAESYILVPSGDTYTVHIEKPTTDTLVFDVEELSESIVVASSTLASAVTQNTTLSFTITSGILDASPFTIDIDGDATEDASVTLPLSKTTFTHIPSRISEKIRTELQPAANHVSQHGEIQIPIAELVSPTPVLEQKTEQIKNEEVFSEKNTYVVNTNKKHSLLMLIRTQLQNLLTWILQMWRLQF